mmetsp:Transcript_14055/g.15537  ORF Transcript_14055/g.15537 Transcript_14055/m.15537 type:complete len:84 (+) Transcript_14055:448-699(+)
METLQLVEGLHEHVLAIKDKESDELPFVMAGNKCDLVKAREVETETAVALATKLNVPHFEVSAKTRLHVIDTFESIIREMVRD